MTTVRLTDAERQMLRGLGQGQVPAVVEQILTARLALVIDETFLRCPRCGMPSSQPNSRGERNWTHDTCAPCTAAIYAGEDA